MSTEALKLPALEDGHGEFFVSLLRQRISGADFEPLFAEVSRTIKSQSPTLIIPTSKSLMTHYGSQIPPGFAGLLFADGGRLTKDGRPSVRLASLRYDRALCESKRELLKDVPIRDFADWLCHEARHLFKQVEKQGRATTKARTEFHCLIHSALSLTNELDKIDAFIEAGLVPGLVVLYTAEKRLRCMVSPVAVVCPPAVVEAIKECNP